MKVSKSAIVLWGVVSLLMILHFFLLMSVGVVTSELRRSLDLTALELSFLSSSYLYIYILLQTPAGVLLDEFGARRILTVGAVIASLGCWMFACSTTLTEAIVGRLLMGGGLAFVFISSIQLAGRWFAPRYLGLMIGMSEAAGMAGAITGNMLLAIFMGTLGWRNSFYIAAVLAVVLAVLTWAFVRDYPEGKQQITERNKLSMKKVQKNLKDLLKQPIIWLHSCYMALMYASITVFSALWANPFLRRAFDLTLDQSTFACSLVLFGIGIGSPVAGILFHTHKAQNLCIKVCAALMLIVMCMLLYIPTLSYLLITLLMFTLGLSGSSLILSFTVISKYAAEGAKSTTVGFANAISLVSAILFQPVIGWLLSVLSKNVAADSLEYYSAHNYRVALTVLPVLIALALISAILIGRKPSPQA